MKMPRRTETVQAKTAFVPFLRTGKQCSAFCLLLFLLLSGCATEQGKTVEEYARPAPAANSPKESSEIPKSEKQNTEPAHTEKKISDPAVAETSLHREPNPADDKRKERNISPPEENTVPQKPSKELPSGKISIRVQNEDLGLLLRSLARIANISIMLSENVKGKATIDIQNKPWNQIFTSLLRTHSLICEWDGDIVRVMTLEDMGQDVRELELQQKREEQKRSIETVAPLATAVFRIDYADANNLREIFEKFLEESPNVRRGSVMVDKHSNSLIVQAREKEIEQMRHLVEKLDLPTRQIRIEAQIVEATSDTARELGIEWGGYYSAGIGGGKKIWVTPGIDSAAAKTLTGTSDTATDTTGTGTANSNTDSSTGSSLLMQNLGSTLTGGSGLLMGVFLSDPGKYLLGLQLSALEKEGKIRILSNPSISTMDNQTALIESGEEVPYQTVEDNEVNIEFKKAVLSLEVTPHVIEDNLLKMKIITSKDELDFGSGLEGNPKIITKKAQTNVILHDGQTMVIGGLRKDTTNAGESGLPLLKEIPLLGGLFKKEYRSTNMQELLIFITPRIVK